MKIAILGRQPEIGIAELESIFSGENIRVLSQSACLIDTPKINISHFGSILKVGEVVFEVKTQDWKTISEKIVKDFVRDFKNANHKITLCISSYNIKTSVTEVNKTLGIIKQKMKKEGVSIRTINNKKDTNLSTAISHNNKLGLSDNKIELIAVGTSKGIIVAVSEGSQNITSYARRDQNRPKRDAFVGMLPPKLAQTIINLASGKDQPKILSFYGKELQKEYNILDPFCGTGTVLQEAVLKGFKAYGSDLNPKMVDYSKQNIEWLMQEFKPFGEVKDIAIADATSNCWKYANTLSAIACETYLGQPFSAPPSDKKLSEVKETCNKIISNFLKNLAKQIPEGTPLCIAIPTWRTKNGDFSHLPLVDFLEELGYNRKEFLRVKPNSLIYFRENQVVARELLVLIRSKNVKS